MIDATFDSPETITPVLELTFAAFPSCPSTPYPQHATRLQLVTPQVVALFESFVRARLVNVSPPRLVVRTCLGVLCGDVTVPFPSCP
jgi:hypothetical protein